MPVNIKSLPEGVVTVMIGMVANCLSIFPSFREPPSSAEAKTASNARIAKTITKEDPMNVQNIFCGGDDSGLV